jgi:hypothetical protein
MPFDFVALRKAFDKVLDDLEQAKLEHPDAASGEYLSGAMAEREAWIHALRVMNDPVLVYSSGDLKGKNARECVEYIHRQVKAWGESKRNVVMDEAKKIIESKEKEIAADSETLAAIMTLISNRRNLVPKESHPITDHDFVPFIVGDMALGHRARCYKDGCGGEKWRHTKR